MYFFKKQKSRFEMQREIEDLRMKLLRSKLDLTVLILTPNSRRAAKIKESHLFNIGGVRTPQNRNAITDVTPIVEPVSYFR